MQWLRANVDDRCADWFETHWTGLVKRRYLLCSCGVCLVSNNQSLESCWRWDRRACTSGSQAISPIFYIAHLIFYVPDLIFSVPYLKLYVLYLRFDVPFIT